MKRVIINMTLAFAIVIGTMVTAHANNIVIGNLRDNHDGTITDTDTSLMWLQDANLAATETFGVSGINSVGWTSGGMSWNTANDWIAAMNSANYLGYSDWRLSTVTDIGDDGCNWSLSGGTDCGYNVDTSTSEMAHLFYDELGNLAYYDTSGSGHQTGWGLTETGPFANLQSHRYWTSINGWKFDFGDGHQTTGGQSYDPFAWAVRDVSAVPEPSTMLLLGSGLAGLAAWRKRQGRDIG